MSRVPYAFVQLTSYATLIAKKKQNLPIENTRSCENSLNSTHARRGRIDYQEKSEEPILIIPFELK